MKEFFENLKEKIGNICTYNIINQSNLVSNMNYKLLKQVRYVNNNFFKDNKKVKLNMDDFIYTFRIPNIFGFAMYPSVRNNTNKYIKDLEIFKNKLEENFNKNDLKNLYKNIDKVLISKNKLNGRLSNGYSASLNIVELSHKEALYHELMHMASSYYVDFYDEYETHSGFCIRNDLGLNEGVALNEGYTELMVNRYFGVDISNSGYSDQIEICKQIEQIIGKNKMEKLYLSGNTLNSALSKVMGSDLASQFIRKNDELLYLYIKNIVSKFVSKKDKIKYEELKKEIFLMLSNLNLKNHSIKDVSENDNHKIR